MRFASGMHFLYVDESGDTGSTGSPNNHFILCGLMIHHADWRISQLAMLAMRQRMWEFYGLPPEAEIHASEFLGNSSTHLGLTLRQRMQCLLHALGFLGANSILTPFRVMIDKNKSARPLHDAWTGMLALVVKELEQRPNHAHCTSPGLAIICDDRKASTGQEWSLALDTHKTAKEMLIDLPFGRESHHSHHLQLCDLLCFLTKQTLVPNKFFRSTTPSQLLRRYAKLFPTENLSNVDKE